MIIGNRAALPSHGGAKSVTDITPAELFAELAALGCSLNDTALITEDDAQ